MKALELAEQLDKPLPSGNITYGLNHHSALMLRKQHEAIKVLRDDLTALLNDRDAQNIYDAKQTLEDTEEFIK